MKIALHSITYAGLFYEGGPLSIEQILERATRIRDAAASRGLTLPFVAGYIDLSKPIASDREKELVFARETMRLARDLGSPYVRVYAGGEKIHDGAPIADQWQWCVEHVR